MPKRHFLGGYFSTKCRKLCRNGISYENNDPSQDRKNRKKCHFGITYNLEEKGHFFNFNLLVIFTSKVVRNAVSAFVTTPFVRNAKTAFVMTRGDDRVN